MNSLVKVFSNFKEFYNEINGATLTGAIDVIVVEQPDGEFQCSPFHVRFGKLGVLRSREKVVDIEINGEVVDIHMKLGESGEAFFVEECSEDYDDMLPDNLATSPIPINEHFSGKYLENSVNSNNNCSNYNHNNNENGNERRTLEELQMSLPKPRRNSIDLSEKMAYKDGNRTLSKFENQTSDYSLRRHTDNTLIDKRKVNEKLKEYTTQKLRQEWAEREEIFQLDNSDKDKVCITYTPNQGTQMDDILKDQDQHKEEKSPIDTVKIDNLQESLKSIPKTTVNGFPINSSEYKLDFDNSTSIDTNKSHFKEETKSKKKRRKRSQMRKVHAQRNSTNSNSWSDNVSLENNKVEDNTGLKTGTGVGAGCKAEDNKRLWINSDDIDTNSISMSNTTTHSSSNDEVSPKSNEQQSASLITATPGDDSLLEDSTNVNRRVDLDIHFFSDTEITTSGGRPSSPIQSDSELEISSREKDIDKDLMTNSASWKWGELPTPKTKKTHNVDKTAQAQAQHDSMLSNMFNFMKKTNNIRKQVNDDGIYLSDLNVDCLDPDVKALYFPKISKQPVKDESSNVATVPNMALSIRAMDDDRESGNGTLPHSRSSFDGPKSLDSDYDDCKLLANNKYLDFVAMSLCGLPEKGNPTEEEFEENAVRYQNVCENPSLFASPNLVVRLNGKYYSWTAACPIVMTLLTFQKPLTDHVIEQLMSNSKQNIMVPSIQDIDKCEVDANTETGVQNTGKRSWWYWRRSQQPNTKANTNSNKDGKSSNRSQENTRINEKEMADQIAVVATQTTRPNTPNISENTLSKTDSIMFAENTSALLDNIEDLSQTSCKSAVIDTSIESKNINKSERYKKSLRLSSEAIKHLNLNEGMNEIEFSVTTAYQGTTRCKCYLFRWKYNDKVVISDIDGTITKSDVLGQILPMVGKDWAQLGVAQLFSKIEQNGYKLLYLSARAIGQSRVTREYLRSIRQGNVKLPDGPLLLNPTSLISALHREVIERKPEEFKIACLSDIKELFPNKDPFYAGYGNRINDVWAYRAVGIPIKRIFTINTKGELKHELTQTFQSSYCNMAFIADQLFPPIRSEDVAAIEFSHFNYWRDPIPQLNFKTIQEIKSSNFNQIIVSSSSSCTKTADSPTTTTESYTILATEMATARTQAHKRMHLNMDKISATISTSNNNNNSNTNYSNNYNTITNTSTNNNDINLSD